MATKPEKVEAVDTICALSTALGRSALAVIRLSGPGSLFVLQKMTGRKEFHPRRATYEVLRDRDDSVLDEAVVTYYPAPNSFTGEDMVEISCHGNPIIVEGILNEIVSRETRLAEPGEFSQRAFVNGKLGLQQLESLDWILNSRSPAGFRRGLRAKLEGLGAPLKEIEAGLMEVLGDIQSQLDFPEYEVGRFDKTKLISGLRSFKTKLEASLGSYTRALRTFNSWKVVIIGPPNSGKSSLFNRLLGYQRSIVFNQAGTTRDLVEDYLSFEAMDLVLVDTAGIREANEAIEALGIEKTLASLKEANVICWLTDTGVAPPGKLMELHADKNWLVISSKQDSGAPFLEGSLGVSAHTGEGLDDLRKLLKPLDQAEKSDELGICSERQRVHLEAAIAHLEKAAADIESDVYLEIAAESLGLAKKELELILGEIPNDDIIRSILSRFCIGK
ncbi:MAG: tRNA uridine-5-carboxymethylaminomethyl(34) synthesis GTPase MnmE [Deltaproteobacteria bacterium CG11_big_fil_rev_8_21_14_0_20_45_16]|nr:MAG: tRNA uridine-5-carboxymethylaminomethyl(34) synthesis GTPase MnmE [Deltaproteobacteria bacterium CG11_big_fil_rev_8_21_14_0_20_45_16]